MDESTRTWRDRVARWHKSGHSARVFAEQEGVNAGTLYSWSRRLGMKRSEYRQRSEGARALVLCVCACALVVVPAPARAFELSGGVSVGGFQIGTGPRLALSPFGGLLWHQEQNFKIELHNMFSVVPGARVGIYDRTAVSLVYAWKTGKASLGPSVSIYSRRRPAQC